MTEIKQPKIRFKGHINDWEQRKLGEIVCISSGFTGDSSLNIGQYELTRIETIATGQVNINKIGYSNKEPDKKYLLDKGDILFSNINSLTHIGKVALFDLDIKLYHGINLLRLQPINVNSQFLYQSFKQNKHLEWAKSHANQAINQASINQTELSKQVFLLPSQQEQQKIGEFLKTLDETIALHQQKLEVTKQFKQTMLKKMFPKNGETTPEIRFKGFTDDWEECKLGDLCDISSGYNWKSKDYSVDGRFKVITIANVTGEYFINTDIGNNIDISNIDNKYVLKENDILITMTGNVGRVSKVPDGNYLLNQRVCKISPNYIDNEFLYTILSDIKFENYCVLQGQGLAQANISNKDILNYKIDVPNIKEQIIISNFFKNIDMNILYLENKIEQNKLFKSSMLKNLFI